MQYEQRNEVPFLRLSDLLDPSRVGKLRKPDFQRATSAWEPEDCVSLLDTIVNEQVVPSIIMWWSPDNGLEYILDGGHRISVVVAWLRDDWGDQLPADEYRDEEEDLRRRGAAVTVRKQVGARIGHMTEFKEADAELSRIVEEGGSPADVMDPRTFKRGLFYGRLLKGLIHFNI